MEHTCNFNIFSFLADNTTASVTTAGNLLTNLTTITVSETSAAPEQGLFNTVFNTSSVYQVLIDGFEVNAIIYPVTQPLTFYTEQEAIDYCWSNFRQTLYATQNERILLQVVSNLTSKIDEPFNFKIGAKVLDSFAIYNYHRSQVNLTFSSGHPLIGNDCVGINNEANLVSLGCQSEFLETGFLCALFERQVEKFPSTGIPKIMNDKHQRVLESLSRDDAIEKCRDEYRGVLEISVTSEDQLKNFLTAQRLYDGTTKKYHVATVDGGDGRYFGEFRLDSIHPIPDLTGGCLIIDTEGVETFNNQFNWTKIFTVGYTECQSSFPSFCSSNLDNDVITLKTSNEFKYETVFDQALLDQNSIEFLTLKNSTETALNLIAPTLTNSTYSSYFAGTEVTAFRAGSTVCEFDIVFDIPTSNLDPNNTLANAQVEAEKTLEQFYLQMDAQTEFNSQTIITGTIQQKSNFSASFSCQDGQFTCNATLTCLDDEHVCDGIVDCNDGSDEDEILCNSNFENHWSKSIDRSCGGEIRTSKTISISELNSYYKSNLDCQWTVVIPDKHVLFMKSFLIMQNINNLRKSKFSKRFFLIYFHDFSLEYSIPCSESDYFEIQTDLMTLQFCGYHETTQFQRLKHRFASEYFGQNIVIKFHSDAFTQYCGFTFTAKILPSRSMESVTCPSSTFECSEYGDVNCIPNHWVCDGKKDCSSGEDERNCNVGTYPFSIPSIATNRDISHSGFVCNDGIEIPSSWFSDGFYDCPDGSDEISDLEIPEVIAKNTVFKTTQFLGDALTLFSHDAYPNDYLPNYAKTWKIESSSGRKIRLYFLKFLLPDTGGCLTDRLDIIDGRNGELQGVSKKFELILLNFFLNRDFYFGQKIRYYSRFYLNNIPCNPKILCAAVGCT